MNSRSLLALAGVAALPLVAGCAISLEPDLRGLTDASTDGADVSRPDAPPDAPPDTPPPTDGCVPQPETCNGRDDNCNGVVDDGIACVDVVTCSPEVCNGIDDDCNGVVDDHLGAAACGIGACQRTVQNCVNGVAQTCVPGPPSMEVCNGIDDDCDGMIDNGPTCEGCARAIDPLEGWFYRAAVEVVDIDETEFGSGVLTAALGMLPPTDVTPMAQREGDCVFDPAGAMAPRDMNLGTIRTQQPSLFDQTLTYDLGSQHYTQPMPLMSDALNPNAFVLMNIAGGPDGPASDSRMLPPPPLRRTDIQWQMNARRGQPFTVQFPVQSDAADEMAVLLMFDGMSQATVTCAVPLCRGSVTVPGAITANFASGQQVGYLRFVRTQPLGQYTPTVRFRASYGAVHPVNFQ